MKTFLIPLSRALSIAAAAAVCFLALPSNSQAKDKDKDDDKGKKHRRGHKGDSQHRSQGSSRSSGHEHDHDHDDHDHRYYTSRPRSTFTLSLGNGYAGRGYYYGPSNSTYYYERPEVRYFATREAAPREYYTTQSYRSSSTESAVQSALARRGYYRGAIDGSLGPMSRNAIASYQEDQGLRATGRIDSSLLRSLQLQ